jgi:hypothetical protein
MCSFELPTVARGAGADCVSISVKIINTVATGVVGFQQVELLANLIDNPSVDTGAVADPWIPYGWTNNGLDAGDSEIETVLARSGGACIQSNVGWISGENIGFQFVSANNKFFCLGTYVYSNNSSRIVPWTAYLQSTLNGVIGVGGNSPGAWKHNVKIGRVGAANPVLSIDGNSDSWYLDDLYAILLDDVSLTVTPASAANSVESGGIRVDGLDNCRQAIPVGRLFATQGWIRFRYIPRHNGADVLKFGITATELALIWGNANNFIELYWSAAGTIKLATIYGGVYDDNNWVTAGYIVAGNSYLFEIRYAPTGLQLLVDNVVRTTVPAVTGYAVAATQFYPGNDNATTHHNDAVFLAP